ncbi:MAG: M20 aminoacylase family protein [Limnohabitans sp.]
MTMNAPVEPKKFAFSQNILPAIQDMAKEMVEVRHQIHAHPELAFEDHATSDMVAARLKEWGYEVHRGLAGTGVVGTLKRGTGKMRLGIRADMDALPIQETTGLPYASQLPGKMHACGHDGHTAILLAAARSIAQDPQFDGTLNLIFQPAEEGLGGGRVMVEQGLFKLFPCDAIFALHNMPGMPEGQFGFRAGAFMPSSDTVNITVRGKGGHGSAPHLSADPVVAAAHIVVALQTVVSRNVDPREMAVISVGAIHGGEAANVIPQNVTMRLTVRAFNPDIRVMLKQRITDLVQSQAQTLGVQADVDYDWRYPSLINDEASTAFAKQVALDWLGDKGVIPNLAPLTGSEDFSFMLQECPGCYLIVGNGQGEHHHTGGCMVHNPGYDFNDAILPIAASYWVKLVNAYLKAA